MQTYNLFAVLGIVLMIIMFAMPYFIGKAFYGGKSDGFIFGYKLGYFDGQASGYKKLIFEMSNYSTHEWFGFMDEHSKEDVWYLRLGNDTVLVEYPDGEIYPFAVPRGHIHERCLNGTWYCTERVCIVLKALRMPDLVEREPYLCTEQHFADLYDMFKESGWNETQIKTEMDDIRLECALQETHGGAI